VVCVVFLQAEKDSAANEISHIAEGNFIITNSLMMGKLTVQDKHFKDVVIFKWPVLWGQLKAGKMPG
jgi:hypothetical protein